MIGARAVVPLVVWLLALGANCPELRAQTKQDVPDLIKKLKKPFSKDIIEAAEALGKIGPDAKDATKPLAEALPQAKFSDARVAIIEALGKIGPGAKEAVPLLQEVSKNGRFSDERKAAKKALEHIQKK